LLKSGKVKGVRFDTLARICAVLECQPGDVLEYRADLADLAGDRDV
jgi:putative transcriptional regulator